MTTLAAWLWQGLAIACATAALLACAPRLNAATRHLIWWMACAAVLALPLAYVLVASPSSAALAPATVPLPTSPDRLAAFALLAWAAFAAAGFCRLAASIRALRRLKRAGDALDPGVAARVSAWPEGGARPSLRVSSRVPGACALGLGRPVILLSRSLVDTLEDEDLRAIVMHEHAHLARRDDWWQVLQAVVAAIAGWHPAMWIIGRRIALEREAACDDHVVERTRAPRAYARALVHAAESRHGWLHAFDRAAIPGAAVSVSTLRRRVRRLLDGRLDRAPHPVRRTTLAVLATMAIAVAAAARVPAMVVFVDITSLLPRVDVSWVPRARPAPPAPLAGVPAPEARTANRRISVNQDTRAIPPAPAPVPSVPVTAGALRAPDGTGIVPSALPAAASAVPDARQPESASTTSVSWSAVGRAAASPGQRVGDSSVSAAGRAKDAGLAVGRFFSRAGKRIAGGS